MKIIGVIPARYASSRFPGKPLADICGKPMIWWVYQQAKKVKKIHEVYVATDDERIQSVCKSLSIPVIMTSANNPTHIHRVYEVSNVINADLYVVICGDEPMIKWEVIESVIPEEINDQKYVARGLMREFKDPAEVIDPGNIKIAASEDGECLFLSRSPIPFPYKTVLFSYRKIMGVECYNKQALDFFVHTPVGQFERIEDVTLLRFVENRVSIHFTLVESDSLSVDTQKDLEKARKIIAQRSNAK